MYGKVPRKVEEKDGEEVMRLVKGVFGIRRLWAFLTSNYVIFLNNCLSLITITLYVSVFLLECLILLNDKCYAYVWIAKYGNVGQHSIKVL